MSNVHNDTSPLTLDEESETVRVLEGITTSPTESVKRTNVARTDVSIVPEEEAVPETPLKSSSNQLHGRAEKSEEHSQNFMSWFTEKNYMNTIIVASGLLIVLVIVTVLIIGYFVEKNNRKRKEKYKEEMEKEDEKRKRRKRKSHASKKRKDSEHDEPQPMAKKSAVTPHADPVKKAVADYLEAQLQTCRLAIDPEKAGGDVGAFQPQNDDYFGNASTPQQAAQTPQ